MFIRHKVTWRQHEKLLLGVFRSISKTDYYLRHICLPARKKNSYSTWWIFAKFDIWVLFRKSAEKNSSINLLATDFFCQILAHPVFKMWVIQKPNKVALWNKRHFEEKKWRLYSMFKIFSADICWINIKWGI